MITIIPLLKDEILAGIERNASTTAEFEDSIDFEVPGDCMSLDEELGLHIWEKKKDVLH